MNRQDFPGIPPLIAKLCDEYTTDCDRLYWYPLASLRKPLPVVAYDLDAIYRTDSVARLVACLQKAAIDTCDLFQAQSGGIHEHGVPLRDRLLATDKNGTPDFPWTVEAYYYDGDTSDWLIYVSHEGTITFTGRRLVALATETIDPHFLYR